jgi:hypothetical protein
MLSWFKVMAQAFHLGQEAVPAASEVAHGRRIHLVDFGNPT